MNWYQAGVGGTGGVPGPSDAGGDYVALPQADTADIQGRGGPFGLTPRQQVERLAQHVTEARAITAAMLNEVTHRDDGRSERLRRIAALLDEIERDEIAPMRQDP